MDFGSIFLGLALLLVVIYIVARPWLQPAAGRPPAPDPAAPLLLERDRILAALHDLDFDQATGKVPADDYTAQRALLVAEGAAVLRQIDTLAPGAAANSLDAEIEQAVAKRRARPAPAVTRPAVEAEIEAAVAQRRRPAPARFCGQCGRPLGQGDRFCTACGAPVPADQAAKG